MGVIGRYPFALATGLGLNAFVAFQVATRMSWPAAMGMVVIEGLVITVLVLTGFRTAVFRAIPRELKSAIAVGIGLFIALIGLADAGFVRAGSGTAGQLGVGGHLAAGRRWSSSSGVLVIAVLMARKVKGAILIGIVVCHRARGDHRGDRHDRLADRRPEGRQPAGWALNVPSVQGQALRRARPAA